MQRAPAPGNLCSAHKTAACHLPFPFNSTWTTRHAKYAAGPVFQRCLEFRKRIRETAGSGVRLRQRDLPDTTSQPGALLPTPCRVLAPGESRESSPISPSYPLPSGGFAEPPAPWPASSLHTYRAPCAPCRTPRSPRSLCGSQAPVLHPIRKESAA